MDAAVPLKDGVVAVLEDEEGRFLFIRRGMNLGRAPGFWCFVGGEVEPGEALEAAVQREVCEEVGLEVQALAKVHQSISPNGEFRLHWLRAKLRHPGQSMTLHRLEVAEARWLRPREALLMEPMLPALRAWLANLVAGREPTVGG
jgi:8-oxo-dGTP diphosphatase